MEPGVGRVDELLISMGKVDFVTKKRDAFVAVVDDAVTRTAVPLAEVVTVVGITVCEVTTVEVP